MKKYLITVLLVMCLTSVASSESKVEFGMLIVSSPEYQELLDGAYDRAGLLGKDEGINGWIGFYIGKRFDVTNRLSIAPLFEYLITYVDVAGVVESSSTYYIGGGTWYTSMIFLPTLNTRYFFNDNKNLYVSGEVNYNIPRTWSNKYELKNGGVGFGGGVGLQFSEYSHIEFGYMYVPVDVSLWKTENIAGGYMFKWGGDF